MSDVARVAWVNSSRLNKGEDDLGVQTLSATLYSSLLPGITSVTNRARFYSFHPWLIWSFNNRYKKTYKDYLRVLRRAECLFVLIAIRHARLNQGKEADNKNHIGRLVGTRKLSRIPEDVKNICLDDYAATEGPDRYIQNALGSLNQYLGPLQDLFVLGDYSEEENRPPGYDKERGKKIAELFNSGVPGDSFFELLEKQNIKWEELDSLLAFCPCSLKKNLMERKALIDLFMAHNPEYRKKVGSERRESLALILDFAKRVNNDPNNSFQRLFRGSVYGGTLPDGSEWDCGETLLNTRIKWGIYQKEDLLSVALQGLFAAILHIVNLRYGGSVQGMDQVGEIALEILPNLKNQFDKPLKSFVEEFCKTLPKNTKWTTDVHEIQRGWKIEDIGWRAIEESEYLRIAKDSVNVLFALLARGLEEEPFSSFEVDPDRFALDDIHLKSLYHYWVNEWQKMTVGQWLKWISDKWCVGRHFRVALGKLRYQKEDTFRIRPLEGEYRVVEVPSPIFTNPRFENSINILLDLGLIQENENSYVCTAEGLKELEAIRG